MSRKAKTTGSKKPQPKPALEEPVEESAAAEELQQSLQDHVIERPDGFYWESKKKGRDLRPVRHARRGRGRHALRRRDRRGRPEAEGLQEAESELGINEWIDPDTGGPAEDNVPRIEDH